MRWSCSSARRTSGSRSPTLTRVRHGEPPFPFTKNRAVSSQFRRTQTRITPRKVPETLNVPGESDAGWLGWGVLVRSPGPSVDADDLGHEGVIERGLPVLVGLAARVPVPTRHVGLQDQGPTARSSSSRNLVTSRSRRPISPGELTVPPLACTSTLTTSPR